MNVRTILTPICIGILSIVSYASNAEDIFTDSFETGDLSSTNIYGFSWSYSQRTGVVSDTHETLRDTTPTFTPKASASSFPGGDWIAHTGKHSMRFAYPAGEYWSERRFDLGTPMKDVWIRYWIRVPINYNYSTTGGPNKFIALWSDGYSSLGDGSTAWLTMWKQSATETNVGFSYSAGGHKTSGGSQQSTLFFTNADRGRWMHIVMHFKTESSPGASDGIVQTFRRWQGEVTYTKLHETFSAPIKVPAAGPNGFKTGYLLGWHQPYTEDTEWLLEDFVVSNSSPMGELTGKLPKSPSDVVVVQ